MYGMIRNTVHGGDYLGLVTFSW